MANKSIKFNVDFNPYKKGQVVDSLGDREIRHYTSLGVASFACNCDSEEEGKEPCIGCGDKPKEVISTVTEPIVQESIEEPIAEVIVPKRKVSKKKVNKEKIV